MRAVVFLIFAVFSYATAEEYLSSLKGMQGLRVKCKNVEEITKVKSFESDDGFDFLRMPRMIGQTIDVLVEANKAELFKNYLETNDIEYEVFTENLQDLIDEEAYHQNFTLRDAKEDSVFSFDHFPRHAELNKYLKYLNSQYSDFVKRLLIGKSDFGRNMWALKLSTGGANKPTVFIDAAFNGRDWISTSTALYFIKELVQPANRNLLDKVDVIVLPLSNPDGYEYSHTKDRAWKKTRSPRTISFCYGTDMTRNFGFKWSLGVGSLSKCSNSYFGVTAFSEIESKNIRDFIRSLNGTVKVYLSLRAHGQMILYPWSYTAQLSHTKEALLKKVGSMAADAIKKVRGTKYAVGNSAEMLYESGGSNIDWAVARGNVEIAYTIHLPKKNGFIISPKEIEPVGSESFQALKVFIDYAASKAQ